MTEHTITILTHTKIRPMRLVISVATQVGVIGIGILADSAAMQWIGFVFVLLMFATVVANSIPKYKTLTIAEAKARLADIEAGEV